MFIKHSKKIVCIDSTHETNQYEFPLVTLVVSDEFNKGYKVGFFVSNHADEQFGIGILNVLIQTLKCMWSSFIMF